MCWLPSARHAGIKPFHQQNPPVLNWRCIQLTQVGLYHGLKTVFDVVFGEKTNREQGATVVVATVSIASAAPPR